MEVCNCFYVIPAPIGAINAGTFFDEQVLVLYTFA